MKFVLLRNRLAASAKQFANLGNAPLVVRDVQLPTGFTASATSITLAPGQSFVLTIARDIGVGTRQGEMRILSQGR